MKATLKLFGLIVLLIGTCYLAIFQWLAINPRMALLDIHNWTEISDLQKTDNYHLENAYQTARLDPNHFRFPINFSCYGDYAPPDHYAVLPIGYAPLLIRIKDNTASSEIVIILENNEAIIQEVIPNYRNDGPVIMLMLPIRLLPLLDFIPSITSYEMEPYRRGCD